MTGPDGRLDPVRPAAQRVAVDAESAGAGPQEPLLTNVHHGHLHTGHPYGREGQPAPQSDGDAVRGQGPLSLNSGPLVSSAVGAQGPDLPGTFFPTAKERQERDLPAGDPVGKEVAMTDMRYGVVAGYDGSPGSGEALRWAAREPQARGTTLTVCLAWAARSHDAADRGGAVRPGQAAGQGDTRPRAAVRRGGAGTWPGASGTGRRIRRPRAVRAQPDRRDGRGRLTRARRAGRPAPGLQVPWHLAAHGHGRIVVVRGKWRPVNESPGPVVAGVDGSPPASWAAITFAFEEAALRDVPLVAVLRPG